MISDNSHLFQNSFCAFQSLSAISRVEEIVRQLRENVEILGIHVVSWQVKHPSQHHLRSRLVHSHWSRTYITALSLVESFIVLLTPAILYHKEPARHIQSSLLKGALQLDASLRHDCSPRQPWIRDRTYIPEGVQNI